MVDKITPGALPSLGVIEAQTTNFGGHPPEFWADRLTEKIVEYLRITNLTLKNKLEPIKKQLDRCV